MVSSLDGIIAKPDNSISWFETADLYEKGVTPADEEIAAFLKNIDCYVMGSRTYELALELSRSYGWPYGDVPTIVLTHRDLPFEGHNIEFYAGDLDSLINKQLKPKYNNVWMVGGPMVAKELIRLKLADEVRLSILPIILGEGKLFFDHVGQEQLLRLKNVMAYKNGMVELYYAIKK